MRVILASSSAARLATLHRAGVQPEVVRPDVDEDSVVAPSTAALVLALADLKAQAASAMVPIEAGTTLIACDTLLDFENRPWGKPGSPADASALWQRIRGNTGVIHTGHHISVWDAEGQHRQMTRLARAEVRFADLTDAEIDAYVATGEPKRVAGGFTIDGIGGAYVTAVQGDPHAVVGLSLPLVRQMLLDLGVAWHQLWAGSALQ